MKKIIILFFILISIWLSHQAWLYLVSGYNYIKILQQSSQLSLDQTTLIFNQVIEGIDQSIDSEIWLILGVDSLPERVNQPILTDTILLIHFDRSNHLVKMLSIPRDLWIPKYKSKINALYQVGINQNQSDPTQLIENELETLLETKINKILVLSLDDITPLIDLLNGLEVDIPNSFIDYQFPKPLSEVTGNRYEDLYQTVEFKSGKHILNSTQVNQYIRSRKSHSTEGNDQARASRQQLVVQTLLERLMNPEFVSNPTLLGSAIKLYFQKYEQLISISDIIKLLKMYPFTFDSSQLSVQQTGSSGILYNPPQYLYGGQWVYVATNEATLGHDIKSLLLK